MDIDRLILLARQAAQSGQIEDALKHTQTALKLAPNNANLRLFLARLLYSRGHFEEALSEVKALDDGKASVQFLKFRSDIEFDADFLDEAVKTLGRALQLEPKSLGLLVQRSVIFKANGNFRKAELDLLAAIRISPTSGELYRMLTLLKTFKPGDPMQAQVEEFSKHAADGSEDQIGFDFAMAKILDDVGNHDGSFEHLDRANGAMRKKFPYEVAGRLKTAQAYRTTFKDFDPSAQHSKISNTFSPIFVTGMPRSGTTLVDQILASHSAVDSVGETGFLGRLLETHIGNVGNGEARNLKLDVDGFEKVAEGYEKAIRQRAPDAEWVVDKSIQTFMYIGLALAALPNAKIILVRRDPRAIAYSIYTHVFKPGKQLFSYSLADIKAYQDSFEEMVRFWRERTPNAILEVNYEDLVNDSEPQIRRLLKFAGLTWEDACLSPEKNDRSVKTLSALQVRQPITTSRVDAWRRYENHLNPHFA